MSLVSLEFAGGLAVEGQGLGVALLYLGLCRQPSAFSSIPAELTMCAPVFGQVLFSLSKLSDRTRPQRGNSPLTAGSTIG